MMNPSAMEVYCKNERCGDPEVHTSPLASIVTTRRYRRMNYMGKLEYGFWKRVLHGTMEGLMNPDQEPSRKPLIGNYHLFQCPVCSAERVFLEKTGLPLTEVRDTDF